MPKTPLKFVHGVFDGVVSVNGVVTLWNLVLSLIPCMLDAFGQQRMFVVGFCPEVGQTYSLYIVASHLLRGVGRQRGTVPTQTASIRRNLRALLASRLPRATF